MPCCAASGLLLDRPWPVGPVPAPESRGLRVSAVSASVLHQLPEGSGGTIGLQCVAPAAGPHLAHTTLSPRTAVRL